MYILAPNDGTARAIADVFGADGDVTSFKVTGQDAEQASVQYIIDGKQSMTVLKDVRTLVADAIAAAVAFLGGGTPEQTTTYNNGAIDVRTLVQVAIDAAVALLKNEAPAASGSYNNGSADVPAIQSPVVSVTQDNVKAELIDSGYYKAEDFTNLP